MNRDSLIEELNRLLLENAQAFRRAGIKIPTVRDRLKCKLSDYELAKRWLVEFIESKVKVFRKTLDIHSSFVTWDILLNDDLSRNNQECKLYIEQRKALRMGWRQRIGVLNVSRIAKDNKGKRERVVRPKRSKNKDASGDEQS